MELIEESEVNKLSLRKKGKKFDLYRRSIEYHLKTIIAGIEISEKEKKKDVTTEDYRINEEKLREMLGEHLKNNSIDGIIRGIRYHLWKYNIVVYTMIIPSGKRAFFFRKKCEYDIKFGFDPSIPFS